MSTPSQLTEQQIGWFAEAESGMVAFVEHAGLGTIDARATVAFIRASLKSSATGLEAFLVDVKAALVNQIEINKQFTALYSDRKNNRQIEAGVRSGLGSLARSPELDTESLVCDAWMYLLKRMTVGSYTYRSVAEEAGFLKSIGKQVGRAAAQNYRRRLTNIQENLPSLEAAMPGAYATTPDDLYGVQPDPTKPPPEDEVG